MALHAETKLYDKSHSFEEFIFLPFVLLLSSFMLTSKAALECSHPNADEK